ncbi:GerAB/ArcD/ProY family transporter [Brevibacillus centrosporus]|uniref:GerAB/ArcD/ProY family transporter n=1 Tax=Brevibacillus centrosporus TaxID=54910 RepID=UPI003B012F30
MQTIVKENYLISGFFVFFLIHASQTGIGMLQFQRMAIYGAEQDSWLAVLFTGISLHLVLWMMYQMLRNPSKDVIEVHQFCFGKYMGNAASLLLIAYFFMTALTVLRVYIHVLQVWIFPSLQTWELSLIFIGILSYLVTGGFRALTGFCFFSVILSTLLMAAFYFPLEYGQLHHLLPVFNHSLSDLLLSAQSSSIIFLGFETLLLYFPFLRTPQESMKWAHLGLLFSTLKYAVLLVITLLYFSQGHLIHSLWPTLEMAKIIEIQFLERFELLFIFSWFMIIIPTVCMPLWCCTRILKRVCRIKPSWSLVILMTCLMVASILVQDQLEVDFLGNFSSVTGLYFVYVYIPLLFIFYKIIERIKLRRNHL